MIKPSHSPATFSVWPICSHKWAWTIFILHLFLVTRWPRSVFPQQTLWLIVAEKAQAFTLTITLFHSRVLDEPWQWASTKLKKLNGMQLYNYESNPCLTYSNMSEFRLWKETLQCILFKGLVHPNYKKKKPFFFYLQLFMFCFNSWRWK